MVLTDSRQADAVSADPSRRVSHRERVEALLADAAADHERLLAASRRLGHRFRSTRRD